MTQVVIDTNVVVSANLVDAGPSAAIFRLAVHQKIIQMCISPAVLAEYEEAAAAEYLITGNTQHFSQDHAPTRIITPRDFIERVVPRLL